MIGEFMRQMNSSDRNGRVTLDKSISLLAALAVVLLWVTSAVAYTDPLDTPAMKSEAAQHSLLIDICNTGERLVTVGERGHILISDDQGATWAQAEVPSSAHMNSVHFPTPQKGWAVGEDMAILKTEDGGKSWTLQYDDRDSRDPVPLLGVYFFDENHGLGVGAYGTLIETTDGGQNWEDVRDRIDNLDDWHYSAIAQGQDGNLYIAGEAGFVYLSQDQGQTWLKIDVPHEGSFFNLLTTNNPGQVVIFGVGGYVFVSDDAGENWREVEIDTKAGLASGTQLADGRLMIVGHDGIILVGDPKAETFQLHAREDRLPLADVVEVSEGQYIVVGIAGILSMNAEELASMKKE